MFQRGETAARNVLRAPGRSGNTTCRQHCSLLTLTDKWWHAFQGEARVHHALMAIQDMLHVLHSHLRQVTIAATCSVPPKEPQARCCKCWARFRAGKAGAPGRCAHRGSVPGRNAPCPPQGASGAPARQEESGSCGLHEDGVHALAAHAECEGTGSTGTPSAFMTW